MERAAAIGFGLGIALVLLERWAPPKWKAFVPSASGVGIAMVIPGYNSIAIFLGSLIADTLRRRRPALAERPRGRTRRRSRGSVASTVWRPEPAVRT